MLRQDSNYQHLYHGVETASLLGTILNRPDLWDQSLKLWSNPNGPHAQAHSIWLRGEDETAYKRRGSYTGYNETPHHCVWFQEYHHLQEASPLIFNLMAWVRGESLGNVLIYNVPAGKQITPHTDESWDVRYHEKFNICLMSNPKARFQYEDDAFFQQPGDVTFFRNDITHSVINEGDTDHIVLCVCLHRE